MQVGKDLVVLVTAAEYEPTCTQMGKKAKKILACVSNSVVSRIRAVAVLHVLSTCEATPQVLCSFLGP